MPFSAAQAMVIKLSQSMRGQNGGKTLRWMRRGDRHHAILTLVTDVNLDVWNACEFGLNVFCESLMNRQRSEFRYKCVSERKG